MFSPKELAPGEDQSVIFGIIFNFIFTYGITAFAIFILAVPIMGGGRLTGRMGGQTVGLLTVVTNEVEDLVPREVFSVARMKRDIGANNYIGVMATDRRSAEGQPQERCVRIVVDVVAGRALHVFSGIPR